VIRAAVLHGIKTYEYEFVGFRDGWRGVVDGDTMDLPRTRVRGLAREDGTILGTSRTHPYSGPGGGPGSIGVMLERHHIDAIVATGGEGTLAGAARLAEAGLPVVGVPKTIDNDLQVIDYTLGFDTAVSIVTHAMDRLRTTGESHHRCMVAEVMGRDVGWIALLSGMSAGAHAVLIPEQKVSMDQVCAWVREVYDRGRSPLVVVAEGFVPEDHEDVLAGKGTEADGPPRLGGIGEYVTQEIERLTGIETRNTTLGHIQRGGAPRASTGCWPPASGWPWSTSCTRSSGAGWSPSAARTWSASTSPRRSRGSRPSSSTAGTRPKSSSAAESNRARPPRSNSATPPPSLIPYPSVLTT